MIRQAYRILLKLRFKVVLIVALPFGHLRRLRNHVRKRWQGEDPVKDSGFEAVYAHYDRYGIVYDYVLDHLRNLVEAGFRVTFVTNSPELPDRSVNGLLPYCRQVLWRRNAGYDFGAYKDGIAAIGNLDHIDRLALMNDSVYGPFRPLSSVLSSIDSEKVDVWGLTDSWQIRYHIQSYFMVFLSNALRNSAFKKFWRRLPYVNNKDVVIRYCEVSLTNVLARQSLRTGVICPYWSVARLVLDRMKGERTVAGPKEYVRFGERVHDALLEGIPLNSSHYFWDSLIVHFGFPFLKRELVAQNPERIPLAWAWEELVRKRFPDFKIDAVVEHLKATSQRET